MEIFKTTSNSISLKASLNVALNHAKVKIRVERKGKKRVSYRFRSAQTSNYSIITISVTRIENAMATISEMKFMVRMENMKALKAFLEERFN
jgi:hypothetical protein